MFSLKLRKHTHIAQSAEFENLIYAHKYSFCIVGNSPAELNSGNGAKIDAHDLIIRFNNFSVQAPFDMDYGARTDIWVRSSPGSDVKNRDISAFKLIMFSGNFNNPRWKLLKQYLRHKPVGFFPTSYWHELAEQLKAPPSAGLLTLYTIFKIVGPLPKANIFGFSLKSQLQKSAQAHYFDAAKPETRHNWQKEQEIFETLLAR